MKLTELFKLVWLNIIQNKFKVLLTSVGIIVGAATIILVIAVGQGGKEEVATQFKNLNAGAIDISFSSKNNTDSMKQFPGSGTNSSFKARGNSSTQGQPSTGAPGGNFDSSTIPENNGMGGPGKGGLIMGSVDNDSNRMNREVITLSETDVEDIETFVPDIDDATLSYTTRSTVTGGELEEETTYTIAGVKPNYKEISNLSLSVGSFLTDSDEESKNKICVLGSKLATELFGSVMDAYDSIIYIDERPYVVNGILDSMGNVASGISPDDSIFIPYSTGIKYLTGPDANPTITVISSDIDHVSTVVENITTTLAETYPNTEFAIEDAGSKMQAASESSHTLSMLLIAVATIVFLVGGIGIMNVLFVSVKERTKEIGILKAIGINKKDILVEFLLEAAMISVFGGCIGVILSIPVFPLAEYLGVPVTTSVTGAIVAVGFAILTGTLFGFYPALKASRLIPVEALRNK